MMMRERGVCFSLLQILPQSTAEHAEVPGGDPAQAPVSRFIGRLEETLHAPW